MSGRAAAAAFYPLGLFKAIRRSMQLTQDAHEGVKSLSDDEWDAVLPMNVTSLQDPSSHGGANATGAGDQTGSIPCANGGLERITNDPVHVKKVYVDEYTREPLHRI